MKSLVTLLAILSFVYHSNGQSTTDSATHDANQKSTTDTIGRSANGHQIDSSQQLRDSLKSELKTVIVTGKKPLLVQEIDKTIVNVESMISSSTSNTLEVLEKTPGVSVSINGDISLNGKNGVLVLIDGKPTYLSAADLANYLKALPGGSVDKLELMDSPSAKYDAQGGAIINIRLKRNRTNGFTGSISTGYTQGKYAKNDNAINLNYHSKAVTVFANLGNNNEHTLFTNNQHRTFYDDSHTELSALQLNNKQITKFVGLQGKIGVDVSLDSNTGIGASISSSDISRHGNSSYTSNKVIAGNIPDSSGLGYNHSADDRSSVGAALNFSRRMPRSSGELTAELNYVDYHSQGHQDLQNNFFDASGNALGNTAFYYDLPSQLKIFVAKADYTQPLGRNGKLETGLKSSTIQNHDIGNYYTVYQNEKVENPDQSNDFLYTERISAAYFNAQQSWKRFSLQVGMRAENTHATGVQAKQASDDSHFRKNYTDFFPAIYLNYKLDSMGINTLNLSYTRRLNRPNYQFLNPFRFMVDPYLYTEGEPLLTPQYQQRVELKFQHKQLLTMGLSYNPFDHVILPTTHAEGNVLIQKRGNIAVGFMILLNTTLSCQPAKWWNLNYTLRLSRIGLNGTANDQPLRVRANVARLEINNSLTFTRNWSAEVGAYYASTDLDAQVRTAGMFRAQAALQKKLLNDKMSVRLSMDDIFHSWIYRNKSISVNDAQYTEKGMFDSQRFGLALTYRFGTDNAKKRRPASGDASDEEKGRVD